MKSFKSQDSGYSSPSTSSSASARKHNNEASSPDGSRPLRRRLSPRQSSLREIRMRQSEAQLQRVYEEQTLTYLNDKIDFSPYFEYKSINNADGPKPVQLSDSSARILPQAAECGDIEAKSPPEQAPQGSKRYAWRASCLASEPYPSDASLSVRPDLFMAPWDLAEILLGFAAFHLPPTRPDVSEVSAALR
ncbi:hypothetical protein LTR28_004448 [Elasticomyces elasticus]|nr:hypothetical protein LTR28_004448 [Elasticomyces elasticus]